jgi:hypothetical protein
MKFEGKPMEFQGHTFSDRKSHSLYSPIPPVLGISYLGIDG